MFFASHVAGRTLHEWATAKLMCEACQRRPGRNEERLMLPRAVAMGGNTGPLMWGRHGTGAWCGGLDRPLEGVVGVVAVGHFAGHWTCCERNHACSSPTRTTCDTMVSLVPTSPIAAHSRAIARDSSRMTSCA